MLGTRRQPEKEFRANDSLKYSGVKTQTTDLRVKIVLKGKSKTLVIIVCSCIVLIIMGIYLTAYRNTRLSSSDNTIAKNAPQEIAKPEENNPDQKSEDPFLSSLKNVTKKFIQLNQDTDSLFYSTQELMRNGLRIKEIKSDEEIKAAWESTSGQFPVLFNQLSEELKKIETAAANNNRDKEWLNSLVRYSKHLQKKYSQMNGVLLRKKDNHFEELNQLVEQEEKILLNHLNPSDLKTPNTP